MQAKPCGAWWGHGVMLIDVITSRKNLEALKDNWDELYRSDPEAQYFLSWQFMSAFLRRFDGEWLVLAARTRPAPAPYVALMPLRLETRLSGKEGHFCHDIHMGGAYVADYTGAICAPKFARSALSAMGKHLRKMHWANLHLTNLRMSGARMRHLLENLEDKRLAMRAVSAINRSDNVDNAKCPSIELPATWDAYLQEKVGTNMRQKLRRLLRKLDASDELRVTLPDAHSIDRDIDVLLGFWRERWGPRKGKRLPGILRTNQRVFRDAFDEGSLFLPVLWHGQRALGALAIFVDQVKKTYLFSLAGRDETAEIVPPGLLLHAFSIRHAIENGFRSYDFLRGDEPYKYSFGASDTVIHCKLVHTRSGRNLGDKLDVRSLSGISKAASRWHQNGLVAKAERAYRQILDTDPNHATTLYAFGQLMASKGDHLAAAEVFTTLSSVAPDLAKGWLRRATAFQALGRHADAVASFRRAIELAPQSTQARYGAAVSLVKIGRIDAAKAQLNRVIDLSSASRKVEPLRAQATMLLQRLNERPVANIMNRPKIDIVPPMAATSTALAALTFR
ncbi:GNAT family N-acetyltransferase [Aliihoeflea sp. 40Bstr573]|uniref:GNAT family N-acetyltransferase n=1 Tax=Aliihoeflea sp. 40Bstr573 TaxID=2696467 RepID=UPI00209478D1|nr:GNAT family N-acetyltransferase [Aliihoeflea sp. 40Bstr573]MCO6389286.1 GNAT family N-acetyltransferase [Aliihoeflea sp. 40Bstr573]